MNNLARYRELSGLSQRDLADLLEVSQPTIQRAEAEAASAKLGTYKRCAEKLGITLGQIFSDQSELEDRLVEIFRQIPADKHDQVLGILELAKSPPLEDDEAPK